MAKIIENSQGRRTIRLSAEDVLAVVNWYMLQTRYEPETDRKRLSYEALKQKLASKACCCLPEEP